MGVAQNFIPKLDYQRLKVLKETLEISLALHGGSGAGNENIKNAVSLGINKINVCTDVFKVTRQAMVDTAKERSNNDYMDICIVAQNAMKEFIKKYMRLIGSSNRYTFEKSIMGYLD